MLHALRRLYVSIRKKEQKMDSDLKRGHLGKMMKTQELVDMSN